MAWTLVNSQVIPWCRNGVNVDKTILTYSDECVTVKYSDSWTSSGWVSGTCTENGDGVRYDWEILCADDGSRKAIRYSYNADGTVWTTLAYNADGTQYNGDIATLVDCGGNDTTIQAKEYCDNGENIIATFIYDTISGQTPKLASIIFNKLDGSVHTAVNPVPGFCSSVATDTRVPNGWYIQFSSVGVTPQTGTFADVAKEATAFNEGDVGVVVTFETASIAIDHYVPAKGSWTFALREDPNEWFIESVIVKTLTGTSALLTINYIGYDL